jgi:predicted MarR family transcription regulator
MTEKLPALDRHWHLGQSEDELVIAEFEYALMRIVESFNAWQQECLAAVSGHKMSATDNVVLHITRMNDRPKTVTELSTLMNRSDLPNLKYSIRKLVKDGLLEKVTEGGRRKGTRYRATAKGVEVTESYAHLRREQLMPALADISGIGDKLDRTTQTLNLMGGIYDQSAHVVAFHRAPIDEDADE